MIRLTEKQRQWLWFAGLFVGGMAGMLVLAVVLLGVFRWKRYI